MEDVQIDKQLTTATADLEQIGRLRNDDVRGIVVRDDLRKLEERYTVDDVPLLAEDFKTRYEAARHGKLLAEADALAAGIEQTLTTITADVTARLAQAATLRTHTEALPTTADTPTRLQAALLDEMSGQRAESFISTARLDDVAARYQQADETGADRLFCRHVEALAAGTRPIGTTEGMGSDAIQTAMRTLNAAIATRQHARGSESDRLILARVEQVRGRYLQLKAQHQPTTANVGRAIVSSARQVK